MQEALLARRLVICALALSTISTVAFAQATTTAPTATKAPMTDAATPNKTGNADGMTMKKTGVVAAKFVTVGPAAVMSTKLVGLDVYNKQDETVGEIEDLVIENGQKVTGVVISVGGFLGMGEHYVVVDPSTVMLNKVDGDWRAVVDTNKETLQGAPKFTYDKK